MIKNTDSTLQAVVDRFENGFVVLDFGSIGQLIVPKKYLPTDLQEGDVLKVDFLTQIMAKERKKNLARAILKEILKD